MCVYKITMPSKQLIGAKISIESILSHTNNEVQEYPALRPSAEV